jgi:P-type E1-E2 ATPase
VGERLAGGSDRVQRVALGAAAAGWPLGSAHLDDPLTMLLQHVALHRPLLEALLFSLAIAIGLTPQLLPAIVSVSLSTGSRQLARRRVLVKRLAAIEDLGNIEVLFTDKTGTLTQGTIGFDQALDPAGQPAR